MKAAIQAVKLGKEYTIGALKPRYGSLRDSLMQVLGGSWRRMPASDKFWALSDVSFEIEPGEVVGVIGRNGAGKSTLLKILSRITEPSTGYVDLTGRVGSLLEVGTGFHPELTGRENVYLNGAILGMRRLEIDRKFDEIVAFAEIEKFIDTPAKHYSTGMYMRLAFAVAAHLEPEILLVDEVLAVGDAEFQKKSLGKMDSVAKEGRTVLLVSHNMVAIQQLCEKCLWLDNGKLKQFGATEVVTTAYNQSIFQPNHTADFEGKLIKGDGRVELISYRVTNEALKPSPLPVTNEDINIHVRLKVKESIQQFACGISVVNERGVLLTSINSVEQGRVMPMLPAGESEFSIRLNKTPYLPGKYLATFWCMSPTGHIYALIEDGIVFEIAQSPIYGTSQIDYRWGCVFTAVDFLIDSTS